MADQELSLGTIFKGEVDRSFDRAISRLRSVLQGLASEQVRAERVSRATIRRFQSDTEGTLTNVQRLMGQFTSESNIFQAQLRRSLEGITSPIQQNKIAAQMKALEGNIGLVAKEMNKVAEGSGRFLSQRLREAGIEAQIMGGHLEYARGRFVANDEAGRRFLQTVQQQDAVSKKYTQSMQAQQKAQSSVLVQNERWLNQYKSSPAILAKAKQALVSVENAAGRMGAQMIAAGKGGAFWYEGLPKAAIATRILQGDVQVLGNRFAAANFQGKEFLESLQLGGVYTPKFAAKLRELGGSSDWVGKQIGRVRGGIERLAAAFKVTAAYTIAGGTLYAVGKAASDAKVAIFEFSQGLANLSAITNATDAELRLMGETIKKVSSETKYSTTEVADAMIVLGQAGLTAGESVDAIKSVALLATGTLEKMENTADLLTTTLASFNLQASESARVADIMATAINESKLTVEKLRTSFNYIAPVAHMAGLSLEETVAAMEILSNAGLKGSTIGTAFRQVLQRLVAPTADLRAAFTAAGADFEKLNPKTATLSEIFDELSKVVPTASRAFELFGVRAAPAVAAFVTAGREGLEEFTRKLYVVGSAQKMADKQMQGLMAQAANLANGLKRLAIEVGEGGLSSAFDLLYKTLRPVVELMSSFAKSTVGQVTVAIVGLTAAVLGLYQAFRFLRVVALAALVPNKTITDIKTLQKTGEGLESVLFYVTMRLKELWQVVLRNPYAAIAAAIGSLLIVAKSWHDSLRRSIQKLEEEAIVIGKQRKSLETYSEKVVKAKDNNIELEGVIQRLITDFPELNEQIEKAGKNWEKVNEEIKKHQALMVWKDIKNQAEQIEKLQKLTERTTWIDTIFRRMWEGSKQLIPQLAQAMSHLGDEMLEDFAAIFKATPLAGFFDEVIEGAKKAKKDVDAVYKATPVGKIIGDIDLSAWFESLDMTTEVREKLKENAADIKKQAESISLALQVESIGFTRETAIEKVAARLQTELKLTAQQAIDLAKVVKANWKDLPFIAKTFPAIDYEELFPFERIQKQMELLRSLGPEWTAYFQTIQKGAAGAEASFANFNNIMLMENAMAAKKQIDQMEKDAKDFNWTEVQKHTKRIAILREHLQKYSDEIDKWRKSGGYRIFRPEDLMPKISGKLPFKEWAKSQFDIDIDELSKDMADRLFAIYQAGLRLIKMRDLPLAVQREAQAITKNAFKAEDWVWPDIFKQPAEEWADVTSGNIKKASDEIEEAFSEAAKTYKVSSDVLRAIAMTESGFDPTAKSKTSTAKGIMQLLDSTAEEMGVKNVMDARENIMGGAKYLAKLIKDYNFTLDEAIMAYFQGPTSFKNNGPSATAKIYHDKVMSYLGSPILLPAMNKFSKQFADTTTQIESTAEVLRRFDAAPTMDFKAYWAEHDAALEQSAEESKKFAAWMDLNIEALGNYGRLWDNFLKERLTRINEASPLLEEAVKKIADIDLDKLHGDIIAAGGKEEDWNQQKAAILANVDALEVYQAILTLTGNTSVQVHEATLAQLEELKKEFPEYLEMWKRLEETIRGTWKELSADHDRQLSFSMKEQGDQLQHTLSNLKGAFRTGAITRDQYVDKLKMAYEEGVISYEEWTSRTMSATKDGWENFTYGLKLAQENIQEFGQMWQQIGTEIVDVISEGLTDAIMDFIDGTKTAKEAFIGFAKDVLKWLAKILMQRALANMIGGFLPAMHEGGVVGVDRSGRKAIRKFHQGYAGVAADEVPAILRKNEVVFTPGQMKALGSMIQGGNTTSITVPIQISGDSNGRLSNRLRANVEDAVRRTLREEMR